MEDMMSLRDLARITLRVAATAAVKEGKNNLNLALGHVRDVYKPFVKIMEDTKTRSSLPFSDREAALLADTEALWDAMKAELGIHDESVRITIPVSHVPIDEWNEHMTTSIAHTLCFGRALHFFKFL